MRDVPRARRLLRDFPTSHRRICTYVNFLAPLERVCAEPGEKRRRRYTETGNVRTEAAPRIPMIGAGTILCSYVYRESLYSNWGASAGRATPVIAKVATAEATTSFLPPPISHQSCT